MVQWMLLDAIGECYYVVSWDTLLCSKFNLVVTSVATPFGPYTFIAFVYDYE